MDCRRIVQTLTLALAVSSLSAAPSLAQVHPRTHPAPAPQAQPVPPAAPQLGTAKAPLIVETHAAPETADQVKREADDRQGKARSDLAMIILTFALVVVGVVQARVYYVQSGLLKKTIAESIETRRPWIKPWITPGVPREAGTVDPTPIILKFKNVGATPAVDFELRYQFFDLLSSPAPTNYREFWRAQNLGNVVFPGDQDEIGVPFRVSPTVAPNLNLGIVVVAIYRTQGSPQIHASPVCFRLTVPNEVKWFPSGDLIAIAEAFTVSQVPRPDLQIS